MQKYLILGIPFASANEFNLHPKQTMTSTNINQSYREDLPRMLCIVLLIAVFVVVWFTCFAGVKIDFQPLPERNGVEKNDLSLSRLGVEVKGVSVEVKGVPFEVKGVPFELKGVPFEVKGVPFEVKGVSVEVKGVPFEVKEVPFEVKEASVEVKGVSVDLSGTPFSEKGIKSI